MIKSDRKYIYNVANNLFFFWTLY